MDNEINKEITPDFCPSCGTALRKGAMFCHKCGLSWRDVNLKQVSQNNAETDLREDLTIEESSTLTEEHSAGDSTLPKADTENDESLTEIGEIEEVVVDSDNDTTLTELSDEPNDAKVDSEYQQSLESTEVGHLEGKTTSNIESGVELLEQPPEELSASETSSEETDNNSDENVVDRESVGIEAGGTTVLPPTKVTEGLKDEMPERGKFVTTKLEPLEEPADTPKEMSGESQEIQMPEQESSNPAPDKENPVERRTPPTVRKNPARKQFSKSREIIWEDTSNEPTARLFIVGLVSLLLVVFLAWASGFIRF